MTDAPRDRSDGQRPSPPPSAASDAFAPEAVLRKALARAVETLQGERAAEPLCVVLRRTSRTLDEGPLDDGARGLLRAALSAAGRNEQLSTGARTALAAVAVALRGLQPT